MKTTGIKKSRKSRPSSEPQTITNDVWYYENHLGLEFVVRARDENGRRIPTKFLVPVQLIRASLKRIGPAGEGKS